MCPHIQRLIVSIGQEQRIVNDMSWESLGSAGMKRGRRTLRDIKVGRKFHPRRYSVIHPTTPPTSQHNHTIFAMFLEFPTTVTLNRRFCHPECYLAQMNGYMRDTTNPSQLWRTNEGGPANPTNGECGKQHKWGFCTKADGKPGPPTNIVSLVVFISWTFWN
jgi:hypothetical protein